MKASEIYNSNDADKFLREVLMRFGGRGISIDEAMLEIVRYSRRILALSRGVDRKDFIIRNILKGQEN